ncbi:MAG TPA: type IV toxin-antitoxin system AbiEi family antitoxin domain-containing protein [Solirubrobacterales bacterium]|nr:type IV toxin-antitoxin system AbiEi family antitoxin domain-containing protein [Solirubrobacterales bacterium]
MSQPRQGNDVDGPKSADIERFSAHQHGVEAEVGLLAARQNGVVALEQLERLGFSRRTVQQRERSGRLHRIHQRVYSLTPGVMTERGRFMAAVLACGPDAVLSHRSAAYLWGLVDTWEEPIDVTAPNRRGRSPEGVAAHRDGSVQPIDKTVLHGIPCTSVARTLLDFAGVEPEWRVRKAVAQAEVLRILDKPRLGALLKRSRRRRGVARLRLILDTIHPQTERTRSELERLFLELCATRAVAEPEVNVWLPAADGRRYQADFLWRDSNLIIEADSRRFHDTDSAFLADRKRRQQLELAGWRVSSCTWEEVEREPRRLALTVQGLLAQGLR